MTPRPTLYNHQPAMAQSSTKQQKQASAHDTPAMRQYHRFKQQHPGCILLFRMGDFYELFYDDAELAHKVLGVTLTQRTEGIPMAGVPFHSIESYLRKLLQAGYRVAICDQIQDPSEAKGVVDRDITRVVTPGTLTDDTLLEEGQENPLAAVVFHGAGKAPRARGPEEPKGEGNGQASNDAEPLQSFGLCSGEEKGKGEGRKSKFTHCSPIGA